MSTPTTKPTRTYTPKPWPENARLVPGIHPGLRAHSYQNGQWTNYLITVPLAAKEIVENTRRELEERTQRPCPTRNVFLEKDGVAEWWMSVTYPLLQKLHELSQPTPEQEKFRMRQMPEMPPETYGRKLEVIKAIQTKLAELDTLCANQIKGVQAGDYIPMGKSAEDLLGALRVQRGAFKILSGKFTDALNTCREEI